MKLINRDRDLMRNLVLMKFIKIVVTIKVNYFRILMVEMKGNDMGVGNQGKKRILPTDISHKFSSKEDFLNFFSKQVGLSIF
jgi:hypothetical protein